MQTILPGDNGHPHATRPSADVSVIIVSWNARDLLRQCLVSLGHCSTLHLQVIVVDNGSIDGSPDLVQQEFPDVVLIQNGKNLGFSRANNIGILASTGRHIALVNSDVVVQPGCLECLVAYLDANPEVGMIGPRITYGDGRLQSSCRRFPTLWNNFCEAVLLNRLCPSSRLTAGEHMFYFRHDELTEVEVLVGCFIVASRTAVDSIGMLDESFFFYGEDLDWCKRCRHAGWKVVFNPSASAIHYCGGSSKGNRKRYAVLQQQARLHLWRKHHSPISVALLRVILLVQCLLRTLGALSVSINDRNLGSAKLAVQIACLRNLLSTAETPSASS